MFWRRSDDRKAARKAGERFAKDIIYNFFREEWPFCLERILIKAHVLWQKVRYVAHSEETGQVVLVMTKLEGKPLNQWHLGNIRAHSCQKGTSKECPQEVYSNLA